MPAGISCQGGSPARPERPGDGDRRFVARTQAHQSADWWAFAHFTAREVFFPRRSPGKKRGILLNSARLQYDAICFAAEAAKFCEAGLAAGGGIGRGWGIWRGCGPRRRGAAALAGEGVLPRRPLGGIGGGRLIFGRLAPLFYGASICGTWLRSCRCRRGRPARRR